jgi:hypothetical protein
VIFYDGDDTTFPSKVVAGATPRFTYRNPFSFYTTAFGVFIFLLLTLNYAGRPAYQLSAVVSGASVFLPLFPYIPPGFFWTAIARRLSHAALVFHTRRYYCLLPPLFRLGRQKSEGESGRPLQTEAEFRRLRFHGRLLEVTSLFCVLLSVLFNIAFFGVLIYFFLDRFV